MDMDSPDMRPPYEGQEDTLNEDLYLLVRSADMDINYQVFCTMVDLLRQGVSPEALYFLLTQVIHHSGYYQIMRSLKSKASKTRVQRSMGDLTTAGGGHTSDRGSPVARPTGGASNRVPEYL